MHDLAFTEETDGIDHIRIIGKAEDIVISRSRFLFGSHILMKIGDGIALGLEIRCRKGHACRRIRIDRRSVINKILVKAALFDLLNGEVLRELADDRRDHFEMGEFFRTYSGY